MTLPKKFGLLLYPGFEVLDVFGPLEALNVISRKEFNHLKMDSEKYGGRPLDYIPDISLTVITTEKVPPDVKPAAVTAVAADDEGDSSKKASGIGSAISPAFVPDCSYLYAPKDLDVLIIPGGLGSDSVDPEVIQWVKDTTVNLKNLFTVCTGADIAARAGVLDGLRATTNKQAWKSITTKTTSSKTWWVANARWVQGNDKIWTTAGVSAGTDGFIAWIKEVYGNDYGEKVCRWMEYRADLVADPTEFSAGLVDVKPTQK